MVNLHNVLFLRDIQTAQLKSSWSITEPTLELLKWKATVGLYWVYCQQSYADMWSVKSWSKYIDTTDA